MFIIAIVIGLFSTASAGPVGHEVALEASVLATPDPGWNMFTDQGLMTQGVRGGMLIAPKTNVTLGWRHAAVGNTLSIGDDEPVYDENDEYSVAYESTEGPYLGIVLDQYTIGAKYSWEPRHWMRAYVSADAILSVGHVLMDDDTSKEGNTNEIRRGAVAPGGSGTLGMELLPLGKNARIRASLFLETGYQVAMPLKFQDKSQKNDIPLGELRVQGMVTRFGIGARF
jgi:hypothetical protein